MMRPYQIYAVKAIVDCIHQNCGNGYIWHTTGSGKTLTSFKASTLLKDNPDIDKCLFVVDRKDRTARPARNSTVFRKAASKRTPTPRPRCAAYCRMTTPIKSSSPPFRSWARLWMGPTSATTRNGWSHYATSAWCLSLMNATVHNSVTTTKLSRNSSPTPSFLALPVHPSSRKTPATSKSKVSRPATEQPTTSSSVACINTPLLTPSRIATSCAFTWITSSPKARILPNR